MSNTVAITSPEICGVSSSSSHIVITTAANSKKYYSAAVDDDDDDADVPIDESFTVMQILKQVKTTKNCTVCSNSYSNMLNNPALVKYFTSLFCFIFYCSVFCVIRDKLNILPFYVYLYFETVYFRTKAKKLTKCNY